MHEPWQWFLAALGAFLVGISKTGIAGLGILAVAIFATVLPVRASVGVLLIVLLAGDFVAAYTYRREASWPHLLRLFPWAAVGIGLGALAFGQMDELMVRRFIGATLVILTLWQLWRRRHTNAPVPSPRVSAATGLAAGFTTMIANAAGPFMNLYLLAMRLPKVTFVGTAAWFFLAVNLFKVPFSYSLGLINPGSFELSLRLAPFAVVGALLGRRILRAIDQRLFEALALWLTLAAGLRLLLT